MRILGNWYKIFIKYLNSNLTVKDKLPFAFIQVMLWLFGFIFEVFFLIFQVFLVLLLKQFRMLL
jgi:hypothetical protein